MTRPKADPKGDLAPLTIKITEKQFQRTITDMSGHLGWRCHHEANSFGSKPGWRNTTKRGIHSIIRGTKYSGGAVLEAPSAMTTRRYRSWVPQVYFLGMLPRNGSNQCLTKTQNIEENMSMNTVVSAVSISVCYAQIKTVLFTRTNVPKNTGLLEKSRRKMFVKSWLSADAITVAHRIVSRLTMWYLSTSKVQTPQRISLHVAFPATFPSTGLIAHGVGHTNVMNAFDAEPLIGIMLPVAIVRLAS